LWAERFDRDLTDIFATQDEVIEKIQHYDEALGGISRLTFQMDLAALPQAKLLRAIELIGSRVAPALRGQVAALV
jgi:antitoxin component HigA of HigAB toxin-antitoxin module